MTDFLDLVPPEPGASAAASRGAEPRSLYRKYRPQSFDSADLVGQDHIVRILRNAIRLDRIAHAYLFCGPRGTGKTTTARLLAKAVNCLHPDPDQRPCNECANCVAIGNGTATDVIEIDAASNRGIDDIRDLRERVKYAPVQLHTKFYIVDEAHQITGAAANAFLKTLEEPPAHTKFVLATTDPEELLPTIVSRCQRFDFRRIGFDAAVSRLRTVADAEGLAIDNDALAVIARHSTGSLRDGLSLLDQLSLYAEPDEDGTVPPISVDTVRGLLGVSRNDRVESLVEALAERDASKGLALINAAVDAGEEPRQINRQLVAYLRILLHQRAGGTVDADERARELAARFELDRLADLIKRFSDIDFAIRHAPFSQLPLEVAIVEATVNSRPAPVAQAPAAPAAPPIDRPTPSRGDRPQEPTPLRTIREEPRPATPSLKDRIRGADAPPPRLVPSPEPSRPPAQAPTHSNEPMAPPPATAAPAAGGALSVEQLADLWPRIRQDVKAINRRIEALLASVDPARVNGDVVVLAAAYPFHRDKLNTDEVRVEIEAVISRLTGRQVKMQCTLRDELPAAAPTPIRAPAPPATPSSQPAHEAEKPVPSTPPEPDVPEPVMAADPVPGPPDMVSSPLATNGAIDAAGDAEDEADAQRLRAAKNIFNAVEIKSPEA